MASNSTDHHVLWIIRYWVCASYIVIHYPYLFFLELRMLPWQRSVLRKPWVCGARLPPKFPAASQVLIMLPFVHFQDVSIEHRPSRIARVFCTMLVYACIIVARQAVSPWCWVWSSTSCMLQYFYLSASTPEPWCSVSKSLIVNWASTRKSDFRCLVKPW